MPTNPYSSISISGYNSSPPPDDGSQVSANEIVWQKHLDKIGDPLKTLAEAIDAALVTSFGKAINRDADEDNPVGGTICLTEKIFTIASGAITPTRSNVVLAAETGTTDTLDSMATDSVSDDCLLILSVDTGDTITINDAGGGAGQIHLKDSLDLDLTGNDRLSLIRDGTDWYESARSTIVDLTSVGIGNPNFTSSDQTVTADTRLEVAHGLGAKPILVQVTLKCTTANLNYSTGDEVIAGTFRIGADQGVIIFYDATNVTIVQGDSIQMLDHNTPFAHSAITVGSWRWVVRAWS